MDASDPGAAARLEALVGGATVADALALYDDLPPVTVEHMLGAWRGGSLRTGHRLDGLLEAYGWHGKWFDSPDAAHPLVFADSRGMFRVNPALVPMSMVVQLSGLLHQRLVATVARRSLRLFRTGRPRARLRMVEYRGVVTGSMVYDALPIIDHFRTVDEDTLLGAMDLRGIAEPFMFVLRREAGTRAARRRS